MVNENRRIQSVERALSLLEALAQAGGAARLADLAVRLELDKGTTHGLLNTMAAMGYVARHGTLYALGLRLRDVAQPLADADARLRAAFGPALRALAERSGETCYLAVPCGTRDYLYIDALEGSGSLRVASPRGRREGLTTSAIGRVFLAHEPALVRSLRRAGLLPGGLETALVQIAGQGYALDLQEAEPGLHCLAMPLRQQGRVVAALGLAGPAQRLREAALHRLARNAMRDFFDIVKI
ncbi:IclR family transcriptional regulator [Corticibacter populi]|uniref:IclR family transcriptional regulator n=1 Tax=Corticibacter populi TaxID=1550736 RepID=A0A3M6QSF7_9BURK|nr:IclR family transcriptional regulator [Corticibacter populi]RMX05781.1 IclR family transcriptional regulator [Corticibacter populi]RZS30912.1 IclR family transcriptional regulator [Corticibacter populi]